MQIFLCNTCWLFIQHFIANKNIHSCKSCCSWCIPLQLCAMSLKMKKLHYMYFGKFEKFSFIINTYYFISQVFFFNLGLKRTGRWQNIQRNKQLCSDHREKRHSSRKCIKWHGQVCIRVDIWICIGSGTYMLHGLHNVIMRYAYTFLEVEFT